MEEIIVANLTLDTYQRNKVAPLVVPQGDYGARVIRSKITDLGKPVIVESTAAVSIVATRSGDGESQAFSGSVNADGTVTVPVTQWMLDVPEEDVTCHIVVTGIGYQYSTTSFLIEPQSKANPTEIAPDDPRQDLVTEVLAGENTRRAAEAERVSNENARIAAENARQSAEEQRVTDESTRITNEAQRVSAEASRDATFKSWAQDIASLPTFDGRISAIRKRVENIESGIPAESFILDDSVAYTKDVPENVAPNAVVTKIGGMTYKSKNLIPYPYATPNGTYYGVTFTANADGSITVVGTPSKPVEFLLYEFYGKIADGVYTISGSKDNVALIVNKTSTGSDYLGLWTNTTFECSDDITAGICYLYVESGKTVNTTIYPMLNEGSTALPYEPYYEGLRSAKGTEVKSVGANLAQPFKIDTNNIFVQKTPFFEVKPNTDYYVSAKYNSILGTIGANFFVVRTDGSPLYSQVFTNDIAVCINSGDNTKLYLQVNNGDEAIASDETLNWLNTSTIVTKGSTAQPYTPYVEHTLPIPEEVRPANGINGNVYDYIEWAEDGSVKKVVRCGVADMGTLNVAYNSSGNRFEVTMPENYNKPTTEKERYHLLCDLYTPNQSPVYGDYIDKTISGYNNSMDVYINDSSYTDAATFKAAMSGVMLVYELAEPEVTDISDLITADNLVPVQSGGTMTPVNEYGYAVPSTIIYQSR